MSSREKMQEVRATLRAAGYPVPYTNKLKNGYGLKLWYWGRGNWPNDGVSRGEPVSYSSLTEQERKRLESQNATDVAAVKTLLSGYTDVEVKGWMVYGVSHYDCYMGMVAVYVR